MTSIAVIGAGPAGCAAAWRLHRAGARVTLYEAEEWLGGRCRTDRLDGYVIDAGAQLFGSMFSRFDALAREVGMAGELVASPGRDALFRDGRVHEVVYGSIASMVTSGALTWGTKIRLGTTYVPFLQRHARALDLHRPEAAAEAGLDAESIYDWGVRTLDRDFIEHLVYPQLAAYYGALPEETSAGLYHTLAQHGIDVSVHGLRYGAGSLSERIARQLAEQGGEVRSGRPVDEVEVEGDRVWVNARGERNSYSGVVVATPAPVARRILRGVRDDLLDWLDAVRHRPALTLALLLDRPLGVRYFGLSFSRESASTIVAACVQENKLPGLVPEGRGLLVLCARPDAAERLVDREPREILEMMLPDLRTAFPGIESRLVRARVYRWPVGNPVFPPGSLAHLGAFRRGGLEGADPVTLAGDYLYVSSVEGAVTSGTAAAARLMARLGKKD